MNSQFIIILISTLIPFYANSQTFPINQETGKITFEEVVHHNESSASDLYIQAFKFCTSKSAAGSITKSDDFIILEVMHTTFEYLGKDMIVQFHLDMRFKEGRYKYVLSEFIIDTNGGGKFNLDNGVPSYMIGKKEMPKRAHLSITNFIASLKQSMSLNQNSDW
ncbi:MAG: hypothetical protein ABJG41_01330 [Cyclobacteriaceae bacterium]